MSTTLIDHLGRSRPRAVTGLLRRVAAVTAAGALALTGLGLGASGAAAAPAAAAPAAAAPVAAAEPAPVEPVAADPLPTVQINGIVWAQAVAGRWAYAGGSFTSARPAGAPAGTDETPRANLVRYDVETGVMDPDWNPGTDGSVLGMEVSRDGSRLYVVGAFTEVGGQPRYRIAAFDTATGALVTDWRPGTNARILGVAVSDTAVYVTGEFTNINNTDQPRIAAIDAQTGALKPFNAVLDGGYGGRAIVVSPDGSKVVVAGSFTSTNGSTNPGRGMAALDATTGELRPWAVNATLRNAGTNAAIYSLASDGDSVYGSGYDFGGSKVEDDFEGSFRASWDDGAMVWMEDCHGDTYSVYPFGGAVYKATHSHYCGNIGEFPQTDPWTVNHSLAFDKEPSDRTITPDVWGYRNFTGKPAGRLLHWYPTWTAGSVSGVDQAAWDITGNDTYLIYGGEFTRVAGKAQQGIVRFAKRGVAPAKVGPTVTGGFYKIAPRSVVAGQARIAWQANYDPDDKELTYELLRRGTTEPLFTKTVASTFWVRPSMSFTDRGLTPGEVYQYRVRVTDGDGNWTISDWTSVTVSDATPSAYEATVLASDPANFWPLGEGSGTTASNWAGADDITLKGSGATRGVTGKDEPAGPTATSFASSAYGAGSTPAPAADTLSVEAWFRTTSTSGGKIVGFGNRSTGSSTTDDRHIYLSNNGTVTWGVYPGATRTVSSAPGFNDGRWHHVVGTLGGDGMVLYVDGRRVGARSDTTSGQAYDGVWRVGGDSVSGWPSAGSTGYLNGSIADVATYDRVLTRQDVDTHWVASGRTSTIPTDAYGVAVTELSPTLYWRLDERAGSILGDSGAEGANGSVASSVVLGRDGALPGGSGAAAEFPGTTGAFGVSSRQYTNPTTFSLETWFKTTSTSGGKLVGFGNRQTGTSSSSTADRHLYMATNGRLKFGVRSGSQQVIASTSPYNDGQWHYAVATESAQGMRLYVDGELVGSNSVTTPASYNGYWRIGGDTGWEGATYWRGTLDEVAVYPTALTAEQVQSHYDLGRGILPNQAPAAEFGATVTGDLSVALNASASTDPDGTVAGYSWDFGDGQTLETSDPVATHEFAAAGTYTVSLTVTDDDGASSSAVTQQVTVIGPNALPVAAFTATPGVLTASFDASASSDPDGSIAGYAWTFGDGETGTGAQVSHDYAAAGDYEVGLTVTDERGGTSTTTRTVTVDAPPPAAVLAKDGFGRAVTGAWGTADLGGAWNPVGGASAFSVDGSRGVVALAPTWTREARLDGVSSTSASVHVAFSSDVASAGGTTSVNVLGRRVGSDNYAARVRLEPGGVLRLYLVQNQTLLSQHLLPFTYTPGEVLHVRLDVTGTSPTTLRARVWRDGTAEPSTWQVSGSDATPALQVAGPSSLLVSVSSVSTVPTTTIAFDDFEVTEAG